MVQVLCMHHNGCNWLTSLFHNLQAALSNPVGPQDSHVSQQDLLQLVGLCCQPIILYSPLSVRNPLSTSKLRGQRDLTMAPSPKVLHAVGGPGPSSADQLPSRFLDCTVTSVSHDATSSTTCPTGCPQATGGYEATAYGIPLYVPVRVRP